MSESRVWYEDKHPLWDPVVVACVKPRGSSGSRRHFLFYGRSEHCIGKGVWLDEVLDNEKAAARHGLADVGRLPVAMRDRLAAC
jgi:hypothetical protein